MCQNYRKSEAGSSRLEQNNSKLGSENNILFGSNELEPGTELNIARKQVENTLYQAKKSYRVVQKGICNGVPYRKCHSSMEEKVVSVINKIKDGK